ncbi:glycoside hydrolase family 3 N-terminal domain-containing protein [Brachybacterium sp. J153]|uniref:glycoside hydrolase family 3 N-terminal domain-containing protein n=1 Tax=Brachybacterium sp. J153 TaxID=3116488 RepID=UPI002E772A43|nr:glycoside hydrolase family 3 N-terminal domain-containing protein [Brachybacterium sp. J153]MEE1618693.1 glycoside hydrolase family 3 N-terminal domain-containing protein [Brachybacterium sp. J153]
MSAAPWTDPSRSIEERADALLAELSLEERIAQLGSYWKRPEIGDAEGFAPMQATFDEGRDPFEEAVSHGLGHLTRPYGSAPVTAAEGVDALRAMQAAVVAASPQGIPAIVHEECLTGLMAHGATTYPASIAWGASFDPELIHEMAARIGADMRALGIHMGLAPVLDIVRDYRWGRIEETMGEDPYLTGTLATAYVSGLQSEGIIATLKHFAGHAASRAGRNHAPVSIGRRELAEIDLVPFEMAVRRAGAGAVMNSYADLDGVPPAASRWLLTELLRDTWGFDGTVVSDYWAVDFLRTMHRVVGTSRQAAATSLSAGMDVELPETSTFPELAAALEDGTIDPAVLDQAVRRVLRQKISLGLLDPDFDPRTTGVAVDLDAPESRALARRMAEQSIILLRNDAGPHALPLAAPASLALIGPAAVEPRSFLGCYSFTNHVLSRLTENGTSVPVPTLEEALGQEFPDARISLARGVGFTGDDTSGIAAAVAAAQDADVAVLAVGDIAGLFGAGTSGEGCDVADLRLPGAQHELVEAVLATGTPVVLVLVTGRPYALAEYADRCAAIVQAFMPGEEGASALAGLLSGRVNPSGRLPIGMPASLGGQPGTYLAPVLAWVSEGISNLDPKPLFPFGHGLSYTRFAYSDLSLSAEEIAPDGSVEISATITNVGDREGAEVVQLYLGDPVASVVRPLKRLVGFTKIALAAGESARVTFSLHADRTAFLDERLRRIVEPGELIVRVGASSEDMTLEGSFTVVGEVREVGDGDRVLETPVRVERESARTIPGTAADVAAPTGAVRSAT